jgi:hypothetical protein
LHGGISIAAASPSPHSLRVNPAAIASFEHLLATGRGVALLRFSPGTAERKGDMQAAKEMTVFARCIVKQHGQFT